ADLPDLTLSVGGSEVACSLVWDAGLNVARVVKSGGVLSPGTYTLTLASRADGWVDARGGLLDGNGDGPAGDDYVTTFVVADSTSAPVLRVPDFARGPGQAVNVPATAAGLPILLSNAAGMTSGSFDLIFDP